MPSSLSTTDLISAYTQGYFPMGEDDGSIAWYSSLKRALFPLSGVRVSRSFAKTLRSNRFEVRFDTQFEAVVRGCLRPDGNWINEDIIRVFCEARTEGWAHCSECWREGRLVGGVYGLAIGGAFFAESMFRRETDASKVALKALVDRCRELGFVLFDAQVMSPHLASLGAFSVTPAEYLVKLNEALDVQTEWGLDVKWG